MCTLLISKKRADKKDLLWLLQFVDPEANFPEQRGLRGVKAFFIGSTFENGRKLLYWSGFQEFVSKNQFEFVQAPLKVIQQFNQLLLFLFGQEGSQLFIEEALARDAPESMQAKRFLLLHKERSKFLTEKKTEQAIKPVEEAAAPQIKKERTAVKPVLDHPLLAGYKDTTCTPSENALLQKANDLIRSLEGGLIIDASDLKRKLRERYPDLSKKLEVLDEPFTPLTCPIEKLEIEIKSIFHAKRKHLTDCLEEANQRDTLIREVDGLISTFTETLSRFLLYKDLISDVDALKTRFESERVLKRELATGSAKDLSLLLEQKKRLFHELMESFQKSFSLLSVEASKNNEMQRFLECALLIRLNDCFSGKIPYPDERESLDQIQADFKLRIKSVIEEVASGKLTLHQYEVLMNKLCYDHDLELIRQENSYRAKRIKDFREEVLHLRLETYRLSFFSDKFVKVNEGLSKLYTKLSNPFPLFEGVGEIEDISRVIRDLWIEYENLQVRFDDAKTTLQPVHQEISIFLKKLFDDLEHVAKECEGEKVSLVLAYPVQEASTSKLLEIIKEIEYRFPYASPILNWKSISDPNERRNRLKELYALELQKRHIIELAKRCQALIVYEDERIDQILEQFEVWGKEQSLESLFDSRQKLLTSISCDIYFEFIPLDTHALQIRDKFENESVRKELKQLVHDKNLLELFSARIDESSDKDQYAFYLKLLHRLEDWIEKVEIDMFEAQKDMLPDWVTPYVPACNKCQQLLRIARFEKLDSKCIKGLLAAIREILLGVSKEAPQTVLLKLNEFERDVEKAPEEKKQNIFFFPGAIQKE